jgi:hypothetical protein
MFLCHDLTQDKQGEAGEEVQICLNLGEAEGIGILSCAGR